MDTPKQIAVVTGGNRGIGFETCRQLAKRGMKVVLAARDEARGRAAAQRLRREGPDVHPARPDVAADQSVRRFAEFVRKGYGRLDVLVNNAGIMIDTKDSWSEGAASVLKAKVETIRRTMETNAYGALRVVQALLPLLPRDGARIINVSSGM